MDTRYKHKMKTAYASNRFKTLIQTIDTKSRAKQHVQQDVQTTDTYIRFKHQMQTTAKNNTYKQGIQTTDTSNRYTRPYTPASWSPSLPQWSAQPSAHAPAPPTDRPIMIIMIISNHDEHIDDNDGKRSPEFTQMFPVSRSSIF